MKLQLIRNATLRLEYADIMILIDPLLGPKHSYPSYTGAEDNPTVGLPIPLHDVLANVDMILISHLHQDHFDKTAQNLDDKAIPIVCQPGNRETIEGYGYTNVLELTDETLWQTVKIISTGCQHGTGAWAERLNPVSGFMFQFPGEPTVYWVGDSVWCPEVEQAIEKFQPDIIVTHSGGAELKDSGPIVMDAAQTVTTCQAAPTATVIAAHLEALDHCKTTRQALRQAADQAGIGPNRLLIPADGEIIEFN